MSGFGTSRQGLFEGSWNEWTMSVFITDRKRGGEGSRGDPSNLCLVVMGSLSGGMENCDLRPPRMKDVCETT